MNGIDHFDVELETDTSGIDHFDVDLPDQTITISIPPSPPSITVTITGEDIFIQTFVVETLGPPGPPGPQGPTGPPGIGGIFGEVPIGALDGSNLVFSTSNTFGPDKLNVYLNGLKQRPAIDFNVIAPNQFSLTSAPLAGDSLLTDYYSG